VLDWIWSFRISRGPPCVNSFTAEVDVLSGWAIWVVRMCGRGSGCGSFQAPQSHRIGPESLRLSPSCQARWAVTLSTSVAMTLTEHHTSPHTPRLTLHTTQATQQTTPHVTLHTLRATRDVPHLTSRLYTLRATPHVPHLNSTRYTVHPSKCVFSRTGPLATSSCFLDSVSIKCDAIGSPPVPASHLYLYGMFLTGKVEAWVLLSRVLYDLLCDQMHECNVDILVLLAGWTGTGVTSRDSVTRRRERRRLPRGLSWL
jgi:hypothetical protein